MKTLIINGSSRQNGNIADLLHVLLANLEGEVRILDADSGVKPCLDCRYCWKHAACAQKDAMQDIYPFAEECDNVVLASPVWFSTVSGPTLDLVSRFQRYFAARHFRGEETPIRPKNGILILTGGEPGTEVPAAQVGRTLLRFMGAQRPLLAEIFSMNTDRIPAGEDEAALAGVRDAARLLGKRNRQ